MDGDIASMGIRLAMELEDFISRHSDIYTKRTRITFIAHSLGASLLGLRFSILKISMRTSMFTYLYQLHTWVLKTRSSRKASKSLGC